MVTNFKSVQVTKKPVGMDDLSNYVKIKKMPQQQQSNPVAPQKIGVVKKGMDMHKKMMPKKKSSKMPSMSKVQKSVKKTMGY